MKAHNHAEIKCLEKEFPCYNFDDLTIKGGMVCVIKPSDEYKHVRYGDIDLGNCTVLDYHRLEETLLDFLTILFDSIEEKECTIIRYEPSWIVRKSESPELSLLLDANGINNDVHGITVSKYEAIVKEFAIASFRYNSFIQFLFPHRQAIITPTDHMDLFFELPTSSPTINRVDLILQGKRQGDGSFVLTKTEKSDEKSEK